MKKHSGKKADLRKVQPPVAQIGGSEYGHLLSDIKERIRSAQYEALRAVNKELVALYWDIGRMIGDWQAPGRPRLKPANHAKKEGRRPYVDL